MEDRNFNYVESLTQYQRHLTSEVIVGGVTIGANHPIRVQSMTDTNTNDTEATVNQIMRIASKGADLVRMAVPNVKEANNLAQIKEELERKGCFIPLIADIHFNPSAAEIALQYVSKVRINPGNFYDKRAKFKHIDYTDDEYREELKKIEKKFLPFLELCKKHKTAIRIGANQGSLSDRVMSRYGDTPAGITESVMEFLRICKKTAFSNIVVSIKSSNTRTMVYTVRMLNHRMTMEGMRFPIHIGVTEAGEGEDGRLKSAIGSGTLLADGIGDTIRVSLTEDPENEVDFAKELVGLFKNRHNHQPISAPLFAQTNPFEYEKRGTEPVLNIGGEGVPVVIADLGPYSMQEVRSFKNKVDPDYFFDGTCILEKDGTKHPICSLEEYLYEDIYHGQVQFIRIDKPNFDQFKEENPEIIEKLKHDRKAVLVMESENENAFAEMRALFMELESAICKNPVIIHRRYNENSYQKLMLKAATDVGGLFIDGYGDGIMITNDGEMSFSEVRDLSFGILQASRMRISKTEFVSCPGCGRTLFELKSTTAEIKKHLGHLRHLKIGIMGCVVNGPGEMGDADYGYVGAGPGNVNLYKGQELVKRHIPSEEAVEELIKLIKEHGDWEDPE